MSDQTIRTVFFDADGVLQYLTPTWQDEVNALMTKGTFAEIERREQAYTLDGSREFPDVVAEYFAQIGETTPVATVIAKWHEIQVWEDSFELVAQLRQAGIKAYLTSNQHTFRLSYMRQNLNYDQRFDGQFYSCELGMAKPDADFFAYVLRETGADAASTLFIDDLEKNVEAARAAGLHAQRLDPADGAAGLRRILVSYGLLEPLG